MQTLAKTPEPPYYAVIFTSIRTDGDNGYGDAAKQMLELASKQPGTSISKALDALFRKFLLNPGMPERFTACFFQPFEQC